MIARVVTAFGKPTAVCCDARCDKAWGVSSRPRRQLSEDPDDYEFLSDSEVGVAPEDLGTYEGPDAKPVDPEDRLNRWCFRQCERSVSSNGNEIVQLPDFSQPRRNITRAG